MNTDKPTETELAREILHWKHVAAYLASCHAATLESLPRRTAKYERRRMVSICQSAVDFLEGNKIPNAYGVRIEDAIQHEIERCRKAAKNHAQP